MILKFINLLILLTFGMAYLYTFIVAVKSKFKTAEPHSNAFITVFTAALIAASVNLCAVSDISSDALSFFLSEKAYLMALLYAVSFFAAMWIFSLILFHGSFLLVSSFTAEDEIKALEANNMELALIHGVILVTLSFVISPALMSIASEFIPYPKTPF
jgi:hypothetical protein